MPWLCLPGAQAVRQSRLAPGTRSTAGTEGATRPRGFHHLRRSTASTRDWRGHLTHSTGERPHYEALCPVEAPRPEQTAASLALWSHAPRFCLVDHKIRNIPHRSNSRIMLAQPVLFQQALSRVFQQPHALLVLARNVWTTYGLLLPAAAAVCAVSAVTGSRSG